MITRTRMGVYVLEQDSHLSRWVEAANALDIPQNIQEITSFAQYIPEGGIVIDAGAHIGDHALTYSQLVGAGGRVYAFEPHPAAYEALVKNMARLTNVTAYQAALSDSELPAFLHRLPNVGASFVSSDERDTPVFCRSLDAFLLPILSRCDFIHLDAEGFEPRILRGGELLISKFRPVIVVEICDAHLHRAGSSEAELVELLNNFHYDLHPIPGHDDPAQRDVLCLPRVQ